MPLHTIMTAAKTVSRASPAFSAGAAIMIETISAVSITVTARARTSVPNGSPTRCATTSAWYTAANTVPSRATPATAANTPPPPRKDVINRITQANEATPKSTKASVLRPCRSFPEALYPMNVMRPSATSCIAATIFSWFCLTKSRSTVLSRWSL